MWNRDLIFSFLLLRYLRRSAHFSPSSKATTRDGEIRCGTTCPPTTASSRCACPQHSPVKLLSNKHSLVLSKKLHIMPRAAEYFSYVECRRYIYLCPGAEGSGEAAGEGEFLGRGGEQGPPGAAEEAEHSRVQARRDYLRPGPGALHPARAYACSARRAAAHRARPARLPAVPCSRRRLSSQTGLFIRHRFAPAQLQTGGRAQGSR